MMNRQLLIRGGAISVAAIAGLVFVAGEFLTDQPPTALSGSVSVASPEIRGASLVGGTNAPPAPEADSQPLQFSALDVATKTVAPPSLQNDLAPQLTFAELPAQNETTLCDATMSATPAIDGLFEVQISAPCNQDERVVISHGDLAFSAMLDGNGHYSAYLPALEEEARVDGFLSDDTFLQAQVRVSDFDQYARMIVQWSGEDAIALHAFHGEAGYGEDGHIHALNPFDPNMEEAFLVSLGQPSTFEPMLAQVYSVPMGQIETTRLQLEFTSNPMTCSQTITAFVMSSFGRQSGELRELSVAMPGCDGTDGFVVVDLPFDAIASTAEAKTLAPETSG